MLSLLEVPPSLAFLYATEVGGIGGEEESLRAATVFANQFRTYERLSPGLQLRWAAAATACKTGIFCKYQE